jgi:hypothetical protein
MKIVQSYWSKPTLKKTNLNSSDRNSGGWLNRKTNYMSWALSCLQFRKYYDEVELVTDKLGYELLISKLGLPYTGVKVILDDLNDYHPDLWALGKIYAYSVQDSPFIHADGDVYIWGKLFSGVAKSPLFAQNVERFEDFYKPIYFSLVKNFQYIPPVLLDFESRSGSTAINAGVIGGYDIDFFKEYTKGAFEFVDRNLNYLHKVNIGKFNPIFEQSYFYALADQKGNHIEYLFNDQKNNSFDGMADFTGVPQKVKFIHTMAGYKKLRNIEVQLRDRLQIDHPEYYYRINRLLNNCLI